MTSWDDFLSEDTGATVDAQVAQKVSVELDSLRLKKRRTLFAWLIPATMGTLSALIWLRRQNVEDEVHLGQNPQMENSMFLDEEVDTETLAIFEDLEMLENLEVLEQWNS